MKRFLTLLACLTCVVAAFADTPPPSPPDAAIVVPILVHNGHSAATKKTRQWFSLFKVPPPPGYIDFQLGDLCDSGAEAGCMDWKPDHGWVALVPDVGGYTAGVFAHEMGHVFDMYVLSQTGGRAAFARIVGGTWKTPNYEERFADAYELCAFNRQIPHTMRIGYGYVDTPQMHRQICQLIRASYASWLNQTAPHAYGQQPLPPAPAASVPAPAPSSP